MSGSMTTGQALLVLIENDVLTSAGGPLGAFLVATGQAAGDPLKEMAAWVKLQGDLVGGLPGLEAEGIMQLTSAINGKLMGLITKVQSQMAQAQATLNPTPAPSAGVSGVTA